MDRSSPPGLANHEADSVEVVADLHRDHHSRTSAVQRVIDTITRALGRPAGLLVVVVAFSAWATVAAGLTGGAVDSPMFAWLEFSATLAAVLIAMLILVTQTRQDELADRRDQLTLELALLADRKNAKIISLLEELRRDHPGLADRVDVESEAMSRPADARTVAREIDARAPDA